MPTNYISDWFRRHLANPQLVILVVVLAAFAMAFVLVGKSLGPLLVALVFAFPLHGVVIRLENRGLPHIVAVTLVFLVFLAALILVVLILIPRLAGQLTELFQQVPQMLRQAQALLIRLPVEYPNVFTEEQVRNFVASFSSAAIGWSQQLLSYSVNSLVTVFSLIIYLVLVPFLVFFLIRDKDRIVNWITDFLPPERQLTNQVWAEVNGQIENYIRGKVWEIIVVGIVTYAVFAILGVQFAILLSVMTGLSVLIPYIGAAAVTVPVALVGFFQWGLTPDFYYLLIAYGVIQALDGNLLAPLLFSEVVNLHPVAIIVAILTFGGLWGFWGVFFAIPLATVTQAVLRAWPRSPDRELPEDAGPEPPGAAGPGAVRET